MILVTGISGVGKTHLLELFLQRHPGFVRLSASALLRMAQLRTDDLDAPSADSNQNFLMQALPRAAARDWDQTLVDGHAVIETSDGFYDVPDPLVRALRPKLIATVHDQDEDALAMRRRSKGRVGSVTVSSLQQAEIERSRHWGQILDVPFALIESGNVESLERALVASGVVL